MRGTGRFLAACVSLSSSFVVACGSTKTVEPGRLVVPESAATATTSEPALYAADEALQDVLSGPLEYLGTGKWPGTQRTYACAFRNERVILVSEYCSITELNAFRVDVYSPTRGRVNIYAETAGPLSRRTRSDYFTFTVASEPPPGPESGLSPPTLGMSFAELRAYDEQRYAAFLPVCYGGTENKQAREGCLGALASRTGEWSNRNQEFLREGNQDWYQLVREMRTLSMQHGRELDE